MDFDLKSNKFNLKFNKFREISQKELKENKFYVIKHRHLVYYNHSNNSIKITHDDLLRFDGKNLFYVYTVKGSIAKRKIFYINLKAFKLSETIILEMDEDPFRQIKVKEQVEEWLK